MRSSLFSKRSDMCKSQDGTCCACLCSRIVALFGDATIVTTRDELEHTTYFFAWRVSCGEGLNSAQLSSPFCNVIRMVQAKSASFWKMQSYWISNIRIPLVTDYVCWDWFQRRILFPWNPAPEGAWLLGRTDHLIVPKSPMESIGGLARVRQSRRQAVRRMKLLKSGL